MCRVLLDVCWRRGGCTRGTAPSSPALPRVNVREVRRHFGDGGRIHVSVVRPGPPTATVVAHWLHRALSPMRTGLTTAIARRRQTCTHRMGLMALQPEVCSRRCESSKCSTLHVLASSSTRRITPLQDRTIEPLARTRGSGPCASFPPLSPVCTVDSTGRAEIAVSWTASLRDSLSRVCPASDVSDLTWPAAVNPLPLSEEKNRVFPTPQPTAIHRVPPPLDGSSSRTARGCCTSYRTGFASFRTSLPSSPSFLTSRRATSCSRCALYTPRRSISRSAAAAGQPIHMPCDMQPRATRCACPLDVFTSSRPCSAKRSEPPGPRFRSLSGVRSFHGFLCSPAPHTSAGFERA